MRGANEVPTSLMDIFLRFAIALAIGLLVGLERGWATRASQEGQRVAGVRTFALTSVLGALWGLLAEELGVLLLGFAFVAFASVIVVAYALSARISQDYGITTAVAALLTFVLGAITMRGHLSAAAAAAVMTTTLLGVKPILHQWIQRLEQHELYAIFKLLLISVVLLPVLPNEGFGPWEALNPFEIWWMVVLISAISFIGYFAIKIGGARQGLAITALFGGMVSSTAVTLSYSRLGRTNPEFSPLLSSGILLASGTMFVRTLLIASVIKFEMFPYLSWPLGFMSAICYGSAFWLWRTGNREVDIDKPALSNPFELSAALQFGILLGLIMLLARALEAWMGETGIYVLAAVSGIADVDPVTLSLSRMAGKEILIPLAAGGVLIAALSNTLLKALLVAGIAKGTVARWVGTIFLVVVSAGGTTGLLLLG